MSLQKDLVQTVSEWYDRPRAGAASFRGEPVWYRSVYLDGADWDPDEDRFELTPLTAEALAWELQREAIFLRWEAACRGGEVTWQVGDDDTFGALPEDRERHRTFARLLEGLPGGAVGALAGSWRVRSWEQRVPLAPG